MAAGRTPEQEVPKEILRQSERIREQYGRLQFILNDIVSGLETVGSIMNGQSASLETSVDNLKTAIQEYDSRASKIYADVADQMSRYASASMDNLGELDTSVVGIMDSINAL